MSSINSSYLTAQSTANPIRRTADGAALRGTAAPIGNPAAAKSQFRGSNAPTLEATALTTVTGSGQGTLPAPQNGAAPQRPLRPGSIINIVV